MTKVFFILSVVFYGVVHAQKEHSGLPEVFAVVLGITQDAGVPQLGCDKSCCKEIDASVRDRLMVSCLAICDRKDSSCYLLDATPDISEQMLLLNHQTGWNKVMPDGILLTHAHIGHYTGLMYLGREASGARNVPVYAMSRMKHFLKNNGPWSMLDSLKYIKLENLEADSLIALNDRISITPFLVPHRDEYSETVGFRVDGPAQSLIYIPDIDKWDRWKLNINALISEIDVCFLDGTFYDEHELPGRDMSEIPHPFISESMMRFAKLPDSDKEKVHFIHLNHTNPALREKSETREKITSEGYRIAKTGQIVPL